MLQNSPAKITEADPKLSEVANRSLSRTAASRLGFYWFFGYFDPNLDPNSNPMIKPMFLLILSEKLGLETQVLGVGCSPKP